jgi:hypothetical protein
MTDHEFDRQLAGWLEEGPSRAPERPLDFAIEHARSHPRRRDPLAFVRRDPMASRRSFGGSPVLVFAIVGLLLVAVAVAVVGSRRGPAPVAPPLPTPHSSPAVSPEGALPEFNVDLPASFGTNATAAVGDASDLLTAVESGPAVDSGVDHLVLANDAPNVLRLVWPGRVCDTRHWLTIDETARRWTLERPICTGDAIAGPVRSMVLTFSQPIDASDVQVSIEDGSGVYLPEFAVTGPDTGGTPFLVELTDDSGAVGALEVTSDGGAGASVEPGEVRIDQLDANVVRLTWSSMSCHVVALVTLDATGRAFNLAEPRCEGDTVAFDRRMDVTFDQPVSADDLAAHYQEVP